jgi:hypothetical protein
MRMQNRAAVWSGVAAGATALLLGAGPAVADTAPGSTPTASDTAPVDHSLTVSPHTLLVPRPTVLTVSGHGCIPKTAGQAAVTVTADSTPAPAPVSAAPDAAGDWSTHITIPYATYVHPVTVRASCAGADTFAYTPTTLNYQPYVIGDGFQVHPVTIVGSAVIRPGGSLTVHSTGWQRAQHVDVRLDQLGARPFTSVVADHHGVISTTIAVPSHVTDGRHELLLESGHSIVGASSEEDITDQGAVAFTVSSSGGGTVLAATGPAGPTSGLVSLGIAMVLVGGLCWRAGRTNSARAAL